MKGVDSSVLLRYILDDDPVWSKPATRFIDEACTADDPAYVNLVVLAEVIWSLRRQKGYSKGTVVALVREMLDSQSLRLENEAVVAEALRRFEASAAGFSDCLIACLNENAGAKPTYSLDRDANKAGIFSGLQR